MNRENFHATNAALLHKSVLNNIKIKAERIVIVDECDATYDDKNY